MFSNGSSSIRTASLVLCLGILASFRGCSELPSDGDAGDGAAPIADAGEDQTVLKFVPVTLDGSASFDPDGRDLSYQWSRVSGPLITFVGSGTSRPTFEAPGLGHNVTLEFKLEVGNGLATAEDAIAIHVVQTEAEVLSQMCDDPTLPLHPLVEFIVEPVDGPGPLTIDCAAVTSDGSELPRGSDVVYTWTVDGEPDSGSMETHANKSFVLSSSGVHTVTLCLTLSGLSWGCLDAQNAGQRERTVFVWPRISGTVHDGTEGIPGVAVAANNVPGGATDVTDSQGKYELSVPSGWSGVITPHHIDHDFQPASLEQVETMTSVSNQDFVATLSGSTDIGIYGPEDLAELLGSWGPCEGCPYDLNGDGEVDEEDLAILLANWGGPDADSVPDPIDPLEHCTSDLDCDDGNFCNGSETCENLVCRPGVDPCPAQMCDEAGEGCVDCLADSDCDDGTFCNGSESCVSGSCEVGSNPCSGQLCDEDTDSCFDQACSADADCDDNLFCNGTETCLNGLCASDSAPCVGQQCDEDSATCVECLVDVDCDDGVFCSGAETCQANSCVPGTDPCPGQMCDGLGEVCADCLRNSDCDDSAYCNGAERCQSGSCVDGTAPCSGPNCDEDTDSCTCSTDADCDDGLYCNGPETCVASSCTAGSSPCTDESCDEQNDQCVAGQAISGLVTDYNGAPYSGVPLTFTGTGSSAGSDFAITTAADGTYLQVVPDDWSGSATSDANYRLEPPSRTYANLNTTTSNEDYSAFRNYYVATWGDDGSAGLIDGEFANIQHAADLVDPGDTVLVKAGRYMEGNGTQGIWVTRSGTVDDRIVFKPFQGEQVTIDAEGVREWCFMIGSKISSSHTSGRAGNYITVDGFEMIGQVSLRGACVVWHAASPIVRNLSVHDNDQGIKIRGETTDAVTEYCHVYGNSFQGIGLREYAGSGSNNVLVLPTDCITRYCSVHDNGVGNPEGGDGITYFQTLGGEIAYNIVFGNLDDGIDVPKGSTGCTIHHNIVFNMDPGNDPSGDGNGIKISTSGGGDHTMHHNIVFCNTRAGLDQDIMNLQPGNFFYNNTAYGNSRNGLLLDAGGAVGVEAVAKNNIFASNGLGGPYAPEEDYQASGTNPIDESDYNFIADGVFPALEGTNSLMTDGTPGDPLFVDPYTMDWLTGVISNALGPLDTSWQGTLQATMDNIRSQVERAFGLQTDADGFAEDSPCLNAGVEIPAVTTGFSGSAPDIGAVEDHP